MSKKFFFISFLIFLNPIIAFANNHDFTVFGIYRAHSSKSAVIAEKRALINAKITAVKQAIPYVEEYLRENGIEFRENSVYSLVLLSLQINSEKTERSTIDEETQYKTTIRAEISYSALEKNAARTFDTRPGEAFKAFVNDVKRNEQSIKSLTARLPQAQSQQKKNDSMKKVQLSEKEFQGLVFFEDGLKFFLEENYDAAIKSFTDAIDAYPKYVSNYQYRGLSLRIKGQKEAASRDFQKMIKLDPNNANAYFNLGSLDFEEGLLDSAIENFSKAITLNATYDEFFNNRGSAFVKKKEYDQAISDFTKAIKLNNINSNAYYNRGYAYYLQEDYQKAIEDCSKALVINKQKAEAFFVRGAAYARIGERGKAAADIKLSCKMRNEDACNFMRNIYLAEYDQAWSLYREGEAKEALEEVNKINNPNDEGLVVLTGLIYIKLNQPEKALSTVEKLEAMGEQEFYLAVSKHGNEIDKETLHRYYFTLKYISGVAHVLLDDCDQAINDLVIYVSEYPDAKVDYAIGTCYYKKQKYTESLRYFDPYYKSLVEGPEKDSAAYSIASLYALQHHVQEAIRYLKEPLGHNYKGKILKILKTDKDFDGIRNDKHFVEFLKNYE